jgi:hypothetical protein
LRRCVTTALPYLGRDDVLTVLDDSGSEAAHVNNSIVRAARGNSPNRIHVAAERARETIAQSSPKSSIWLSKTAERDIAPLRNLSLFLSTLHPAETTVLIDDDIHDFDLAKTHETLAALSTAKTNIIMGGDITGVNEEDIVTRLGDAIDTLQAMRPGGKPDSIHRIFQMRRSLASPPSAEARYVSGGYLAFRLGRQKYFAFPPGYNEDWLWCLLQGTDPQMRIVRNTSVIHEPPTIRKPTREDVLFELTGDLVFDCVHEAPTPTQFDPKASIAAVSNRLPDSASMPVARARELFGKACGFTGDHTVLCVLNEYGLAIISNMLRAGELEMDGSSVLAAWTTDALVKYESFLATLDNEDLTCNFNILLQKDIV